MRKHPLITTQYYHIYNRGVDKRDIFMNKEDLDRFVLSIKEFNVVEPIRSLRDKKNLDKTPGVQPLEKKPLVSIVCFCLNPNHFHFIIKQEVDGGISEFFKRLLGGYTCYFNDIHDRSGALFQGRFKSHLINSEQYFLKIRPYVNVNYLIHNIPKEKSYLVLASDKEYDYMDFDIVSKEEAMKLLDFYEDNENFKKECLNVISMIKEQRGTSFLLDKEPLP